MYNGVSRHLSLYQILSNVVQAQDYFKFTSVRNPLN